MGVEDVYVCVFVGLGCPRSVRIGYGVGFLLVLESNTVESEFETTGFGLAHPREASGAKETSWNRGKEVWAGLRRWFLVRVRFGVGLDHCIR